MHRPLQSGKFSMEKLLETLPARPRMMGEADVALIEQILKNLPPNPRLLEIGPWLGGVSAQLAAHGELHVVDRFIWSDVNAENNPGVLASGESFRPVFEMLMASQGVSAQIHETEIDAFEWSGDPIDFCLIDAPRNSDDLWTCLRQILPSLTADGFVLIKHGLTPKHTDMLALLSSLTDAAIIQLVDTDQPAWCNIAALKAGPHLSDFSGKTAVEDWLTRPARPAGDCGGSTSEQLVLDIAKLAYLASHGLVSEALLQLRTQGPNPKLLSIWDRFEAEAPVDRDNELSFSVFSEIFEFHHSAVQKDMWAPANQSITWALRHSWSSYLSAPETAPFDVSRIAQSYSPGAVADFSAKESEVP
ncbi:MAG: hypothetical protein VX444_12840 [Pseudomonadota bacterium]|nr:hypothetical protein [Pseudomonadota bacterium]